MGHPLGRYVTLVQFNFQTARLVPYPQSHDTRLVRLVRLTQIKVSTALELQKVVLIEEESWRGHFVGEGDAHLTSIAHNY